MAEKCLARVFFAIFLTVLDTFIFVWNQSWISPHLISLTLKRHALGILKRRSHGWTAKQNPNLQILVEIWAALCQLSESQSDFQNSCRQSHLIQFIHLMFKVQMWNLGFRSYPGTNIEQTSPSTSSQWPEANGLGDLGQLGQGLQDSESKNLMWTLPISIWTFGHHWHPEIQLLLGIHGNSSTWNQLSTQWIALHCWPDTRHHEPLGFDATHAKDTTNLCANKKCLEIKTMYTKI